MAVTVTPVKVAYFCHDPSTFLMMDRNWLGFESMHINSKLDDDSPQVVFPSGTSFVFTNFFTDTFSGENSV
jgi:hypothetical protein